MSALPPSCRPFVAGAVPRLLWWAAAGHALLHCFYIVSWPWPAVCMCLAYRSWMQTAEGRQQRRPQLCS